MIKVEEFILTRLTDTINNLEKLQQPIINGNQNDKVINHLEDEIVRLQKIIDLIKTTEERGDL